MKNYLTFYEAQTASRLKIIVQFPPTPQDKTLLRLLNKYFVTGIHRNIETFAFKVLFRMQFLGINGAMQMLFLTRNRNMFAGKFV